MKKNKGGRPTKYKPEYCELLVEHLKQGYSFETFGAIAGVFKEALYDWVAKYPEFSNAKKEGTLLGQHFWEKMGTAGAMGKIQGFNVTAWIFNMKNRYNWRDKRDIDNTSSDGSMTPTQITFEIVKSEN
jgi:transposase